MPAAEFTLLAINPGSTSTKIGVFRNGDPVFVRNVQHAEADLRPFRGKPIIEQMAFRQAALQAELVREGFTRSQFAAIVARGGLLRPLPSGTYRVNAEMLDELRRAPFGDHASNLGAFLAESLARLAECPAFIVDPVSVDELAPVARISGSALVERRSLSHALNTKAIAHKFAGECGTAYEDLRLVIAHLGSGISVSAHRGGRMVDVNLAGQEGPFSTERCGGLQLLGIVELCFSGMYTRQQLWDKLIREGGIYSYLGTKDLEEVERRIAAGDAEAALIFDAMVYQVAKEIGAMATVLHGEVDALILTGGMARSDKLVGQLREAVGWIAPIAVYPGEDELQALANGALRVLRGEQRAKELAAEPMAAVS